MKSADRFCANFIVIWSTGTIVRSIDRFCADLKSANGFGAVVSSADVGRLRSAIMFCAVGYIYAADTFTKKEHSANMSGSIHCQLPTNKSSPNYKHQVLPPTKKSSTSNVHSSKTQVKDYFECSECGIGYKHHSSLFKHKQKNHQTTTFKPEVLGEGVYFFMY